MSNESQNVTSRCDRCKKSIKRGYPLDAVFHPFETWVCEDCVTLSDEVVDL